MRFHHRRHRYHATSTTTTTATTTTAATTTISTTTPTAATTATKTHFKLLAVKTRDWSDDKPSVLVTGGVHGYETSGVQGALMFLTEGHAANYAALGLK